MYPLSLSQRTEEAIRNFRRKLVQQRHAVFGIKLVEEFVDIGIAQFVNDVRLVFGIKCIEDRDRFFTRQQP